jgi:hypothetical protein
MRRNPKNFILRRSGKTLIVSVLLLIAFFPFGEINYVSEVHAATAGSGAAIAAKAACEKAGGTPEECTKAANDAAGEISNPSSDSNSCTSLASCIAEVVYWFTVGLGGAVAYLAAWVFSLAVALSLSSTAYALTFITEGWTIMRDLANMLFVLILVYLALTIMFRADTHDTAKKLAWVIVIALIINFSFFFTRVVIDAGNLLAVQFYNAIEAKAIGETAKESPLSGSEVTTITGGETTKDLTYSIMNGIGVHKIMGSDAFEAFQNNSSGVSGFVAEFLVLSFINITVGAMFFMLAATFFAVAVKFIVRIAVLWLLIIASPIAFVANTLQEGKHWYKRWQSELIKHAFYPAFFLFIFYILTLFMKELTAEGSTTIIEQAFGDRGGGYAGDNFTFIITVIASVVIRLGFVLALLYIGLKASEALGVMGANFANNVATKVNSFGRFGGGLPMRGALAGAAAGSRTVVGGTALKVSRSALVQNLRADSIWGRTVKGGLRGLAGASYDARGIPGAGSVLGAGGLLEIGKAGGKGGYAKKMEERAKLIESAAKDMKADDVDIRNAQEAYVANFAHNDLRGKAAYDARMAELERDKEAAKRGQEIATSVGDKEGANSAKTQQETLEKEMKKMREGGKTKVEAEAKERIKRLAERMGGRNFANLGIPSRGSIVGAAKALKLVTEKSAKDKLAEAAKQLNKEEGGEDEPTPPAGGGGGGGSKGTGGGSSGSTKASGSATTGSHGTGPHASDENAEKIVSAIKRLQDTSKEGFHTLAQRMERAEQAEKDRNKMDLATMRTSTAQKIKSAMPTQPVAAIPRPTGTVPQKPTTPSPAKAQIDTPTSVPTNPANDNLHIDNDRKAA